MTIDNETILKVAREINDPGTVNRLTDYVGNAELLITFAHRIAALQREIDARICDTLQFENGESCAKYLRSQS